VYAFDSSGTEAAVSLAIGQSLPVTFQSPDAIIIAPTTQLGEITVKLEFMDGEIAK
jgi:hypothetical protein